MIITGALGTALESMPQIDLSYFKQPITEMRIGEAIIIYMVLKALSRGDN